MKDYTAADWEMTVVLPLGVVAGQLVKLEAQLRSLNMRALRLAGRLEVERPTEMAEAQLEAIGESLDAIDALMADFRRDLRPTSREPALASELAALPSTEDARIPSGTGLYADAERTLRRKHDPQRDRED